MYEHTYIRSAIHKNDTILSTYTTCVQHLQCTNVRDSSYQYEHMRCTKSTNCSKRCSNINRATIVGGVLVERPNLDIHMVRAIETDKHDHLLCKEQEPDQPNKTNAHQTSFADISPTNNL